MAATFTSFQEFKQRYPIRPNDKGALLGSGSYGRVIKVEDQLETEWVAIKVSEFKGNDSKSLRAEVSLAQSVPRQANIARYDACYRLETDTSISDFAIMKYYPDGNLADLLKRETLSPVQLYEITQGILLGLQHLHRHRIVHRDFKPANILISRDNAGRFIPKIADFGLSKLVSDDELDSSDFDLSDGRGTPSYKAPEQIEGSKVSFNLDLWAFGIILYEMLTGEKPFKADQRTASEQSARREIEKKIIQVELPARLNEVNEPYRSMIRRCLVRDIRERARKEEELLDLLDRIPQLLEEAQNRVEQQDYPEALLLYEQVLAKREHHTEAKKGIIHCQKGLKQQDLTRLLAEAEDLLEQQQFELAKNRYEQVLQLNPSQKTAIQGMASCIEGLRPKSTEPEWAESTDVYQPERTDIFEVPPVPVARKAATKPVPVGDPVPDRKATRLSESSPILTQQTVYEPVVPQPARSFPWRIVTSVALGIGIGGMALYWQLHDPPEPTDKPKSTITAGPVSDPKPILPPKGQKATPVETKDAVKKSKDKTDLPAVNSTESKKNELETGENKTVVNQGQAPDEKRLTSPPLPEKTAPEPAVDTREKLLKEQQNAYDQLIEEGRKAISNGNNKIKAIATFNKALALAKEHELSTAEADGLYNTYLTKANKIFATDEYEGAKAWYQVAQALKDTEEVRRKIKQCTHQ
jgi:serine/threonine protein kinase